MLVPHVALQRHVCNQTEARGQLARTAEEHLQQGGGRGVEGSTLRSRRRRLPFTQAAYPPRSFGGDRRLQLGMQMSMTLLLNRANGQQSQNITIRDMCCCEAP